MACLSVGFAIALISYKQLGDLWRSGIDPEGPGKLQQQGLYKFSRNPMYVGVITAQLGFFLALPSVFTLVCLLVGVFAILRQVNAEELHLHRVLPGDYKQYMNNVPRWIFNTAPK
jgi:protein-S-isoprenylcysteine O-methyltransferase Ste14